MLTRSSRVAGVVAVCGVLAAAGSAMAQFPYGPVIVRIESHTTIGGTDHVGVLQFSMTDPDYNYGSGSDGQWEGYTRYNWNLSSPRVVRDGDNGPILFTLGGAGLAVDSDPSVAANFNITAGASNTTFNISSSLLAVAPAVYTGQCSAQVTLTDLDGDGAVMALSTNPSGMYKAMYSGSTTFANLLGTGGSLVAGAFSSNTRSDAFGVAPLVGLPTDISAVFNFSLSANDTATGTSIFNITPAPGTLALLGLGGLVASRRRRMN